MKPKRLVLFDIDGTILWGGPLWKESFIYAFEEHFPEWKFPVVSFDGKTDIQICREMMLLAGFTSEQVEKHMSQIIDSYISRACAEINTRAHEVTLLPGIKEILKTLDEHSDVFLGLLTGNVRKGADAKLSCVGLNHYFKTGVFGDDHWDRYELPTLAVNRVQADHGLKFEGKQIVIIGDTIHDINCGKSIGVRSIAVGTGKNSSLETLLSHNPDYYFKDLSETFEVLQAILEDI